ncbi:MAG: hypothetical protein K1X89_08365 [Myxococcaceae bacterium]|nr:hypothetical protein [Myxococcaceae bacterium]
MLAARGAFAQVAEFSDDFETGTLLTSDAPAGRWSSRSNPGAGSPPTSSAAAAHRGLRGARVVDSSSGGGSSSQEYLVATLATRTGDTYVRTWLRLTSPTSQSNYLLGLFSGLNQQCSTEIELNGSTWNLDGYSQPNSYSGVTASQPLTSGSWHLVEFAQLGAGSSSGRRRAWLDGVQVVDAAADLSGGQVGFLSLGEYSTSSGYTGTTDYDDVRVAATPHVSTFALSSTSALAEGCATVTVALRDSTGGAPVAPYLLALDVDAGGATAFAGASCTGATATVGVDAGVSQVTFGVSAPIPGTFQVSVSHADLLSAPPTQVTFTARPLDATCGSPQACGSLQCVGGRCALSDGGLPDGGVRPGPDAGPPDAGPDGGSPDAGPSDAGPADAGAPDGGTDAGPSDAGQGDAGERDGGPVDSGNVDAGTPGTLAVGCECEHGAAPGSSWWLSAMVAFVAAARARRARRAAPLR